MNNTVYSAPPIRTRVEIKEIVKSMLKSKYSTIFVPVLIYALVVTAASTVVPGVGSIIIMPVAVGLYYVLLQIWYGNNPQIGDMFTSAFQVNFVNKLVGMLLVSVFTFLWSLLFVIPGIVKAYSYAAVPVILAKYPSVGAQDAIKISMRVMNGHKMDLFITELSFFGWNLLGIFTFGLLNLFWVSPYQTMTIVASIDEYIIDAVNNGRVDASELQ